MGLSRIFIAKIPCPSSGKLFSTASAPSRNLPSGTIFVSHHSISSKALSRLPGRKPEDSGIEERRFV